MISLDKKTSLNTLTAEGEADTVLFNKLSELNALIQELFNNELKDQAPLPVLESIRSDSAVLTEVVPVLRKGTKRRFETLATAGAERIEKKEKTDKEAQESKEEAEKKAFEEDFTSQLLLLGELPPLSRLSARTAEITKKTVFSILKNKVALGDKRILLDIAKLGCDTKTQQLYWSYAIAQGDQKFALELIEHDMPLTLSASDVTILERLLKENLALANKILKQTSLKEIKPLLKHAKTLFLRFIEEKQWPQAKCLATYLGRRNLHSETIFEAIRAYIISGNLEALRFCITECEIELIANEPYEQDRAYSPEEFLTNSSRDRPLLTFLALAFQHSQKELYPLLSFDDKNIINNLYAYLEAILGRGDLHELRGLPKAIEEFLSLATSRETVLQKLISTKQILKSATIEDNIEFTLLSRTVYQIMYWEDVSYSTLPYSEEKKNALYDLIKFLVGLGISLGDEFINTDVLYQVLCEERESFPDRFLKEIVEIQIKQGLMSFNVHLLHDQYIRLLVDEDADNFILSRKEVFSPYFTAESLLSYQFRNDVGDNKELIRFRKILELYPDFDVNTFYFERQPLLFFILDTFSNNYQELLSYLLENKDRLRLDLTIKNANNEDFLSYAQSRLAKAHSELEQTEKRGNRFAIANVKYLIETLTPLFSLERSGH